MSKEWKELCDELKKLKIYQSGYAFEASKTYAISLIRNLIKDEKSAEDFIDFLVIDFID